MRKLVFFAITIAIAVLSSNPGYTLERFEIITTEQLEEMLKAREEGKTDFILVNSLDELIFRNTSIPGSINLPWSKIEEKLSLLGEDKSRLLVFY